LQNYFTLFYKQKIHYKIQCQQHVPNLIICEIVCSECADDPAVHFLPAPLPAKKLKADKCFCGVFSKNFQFRKNVVNGNPRLLQFNGFGGEEKSPAHQFLDFLLKHGDGQSNYKTRNIIIAHNAGKFDTHLLLSAMYERNISPTLTMTGKFINYFD
jgi:hypothetical protein